MRKVEEIKAQLEALKKLGEEQDKLEQNLLKKLRIAETEEKETKCGKKPQFFRVGFGYGGDFFVAAHTKEEAIKTLLANKKHLKETEVRNRIEALGTQIIFRECTCTR